MSAVRQDFREAKNSIVDFANNPFEVAAHKLLIPAAISMINGLRSKSEQPENLAS